MCDTTITPQVAGIDKAEPQAKVFIEGKNRPLFVQEDPASINADLQIARPVDGTIEVVNLNGEQTFIPARNVMSVVAATPKDRRKVQSIVQLDGAYTVRPITEDEANDHGYAPQDSPFVAALVDPHGAEMVFVDLHSYAVVWRNPACAERAVKRYVKLVRLLTEGIALDDEFNQPQPLPGNDMGTGDGLGIVE